MSEIQGISLRKNRHILHTVPRGRVHPVQLKAFVPEILDHAPGAAGNEKVKYVVFHVGNRIGNLHHAVARVKIGNVGLKGNAVLRNVRGHGNGDIRISLVAAEEKAHLPVALAHGHLAKAALGGNRKISLFENFTHGERKQRRPPKSHGAEASVRDPRAALRLFKPYQKRLALDLKYHLCTPPKKTIPLQSVI